ncbi:XdhC family protein [Georgenia sp. Z1491]|uniref:XdhC family protein n=1 Tax=Georgenia sp. Z1491 TaxID=3416707 RepID=UPI003CF04E47
MLTHDPTFDIPLVAEALATDAAYMGVIGSRRTHVDRNERLRAMGVSETDLRTLRSPVGLDLGGRTSEERVLSIGAAIIAERWGGSGAPLSGLNGSIHGSAASLMGRDQCELAVHSPS